MEHTSAEVTLIIDLGRALLLTGTPTHRFEDTMVKISNKLRVTAQFFALPTGFFAFIGPLKEQQTFFIRGSLGDANLGKIGELHDIVEGVLQDRLTPTEAIERVRGVSRARSPHKPAVLLLASALGSSLFTVFFNGGWREFVLASVPGLLVGLMMLLYARKPLILRVLPVLGALIAGLWGAMIAYMVPHTSPWVVILGGISVLIPGLGILIAMNELATGHLLSGTARSMAAGMTLLQLVFGLVMAKQIGSFWPYATLSARSVPFPVFAKFIALIFAAPVFLVQFHGRWKDLTPIFLACLLSYSGSHLGSQWLGPEGGAGIGAYLLGVGCNLYARHYNRPAFVPLLPGLLLLVPGSIGVKSLSFLANRQVEYGVETATQMAFVAMALLVGLLLSRVTVAPRKEL